MDGGRGNAESPERELVGGDEPLDVIDGEVERQPAERRYQRPSQLRRVRRHVEQRLDARDRVRFEREDRRREELTRFTVCDELGQRRPPAGILCHAQPVDVRLDAIVQARKTPQAVLRRPHGGVAQQPQERGFFGVLRNDAIQDGMGGHDTKQSTRTVLGAREVVRIKEADRVDARR